MLFRVATTAQIMSLLKIFIQFSLRLKKSLNLISLNNNDTICALATPQGVGAIAIIRLSGSDAIIICNKK